MSGRRHLFGAQASLVSVFAVFGVVFIAAFVAATPAAAASGTVSVVGEGSVEFAPEFVDMDFSVSARAPGYREAQSALMDAAARVIESVGSLPWIDDKDLATQSFSLSEVWNYADGGRKLEGYLAATRFTLRVRSLDRYQDTILALLDAGVNGIERVEFGVSDTATLGLEALKAAFADAKRKAQMLALEAGGALGKALLIREAGAPEPEVPRLAALKTFAADSESGGDIVAEGVRKMTARVFVEFDLE